MAKIAVANLIITPQNEILVGKRLDSGLYGVPGGHLEKFEEFLQCA